MVIYKCADISVLDNEYARYVAVSGNDAFNGCKDDDADYQYFLETSVVSDFMQNLLAQEYTLKLRDFEQVVFDILELLNGNCEEYIYKF